MNITVWNEHVHEREGGEAARIYPDGINGTLWVTRGRAV
jgi:trehalose utilization protein